MLRASGDAHGRPSCQTLRAVAASSSASVVQNQYPTSLGRQTRQRATPHRHRLRGTARVAQGNAPTRRIHDRLLAIALGRCNTRDRPTQSPAPSASRSIGRRENDGSCHHLIQPSDLSFNLRAALEPFTVKAVFCELAMILALSTIAALRERHD